MVEIETLFLLIGLVFIEFSEAIIFYISRCCDIWECVLLDLILLLAQLHMTLFLVQEPRAVSL